MYINTNKFYLSDKIAQIQLGSFVITYSRPRASHDYRWLTISVPKRTISLCITTTFKNDDGLNFFFVRKESTTLSKVTHFKFLFIGGWYRKEV